MLRKVLYGAAGATIIGGAGFGFVYQRRLKENRAVTAEAYNAKQNQEELLQAFDKIKSRSRDVPEILFYRYTTCPFCGKVKAFMDVFGIPHTCVEVEPMFKKEIKYSEYKKVPQLRFNVMGHHGPYLVDSDQIIEALAPLVGVGHQLKDPEISKWRGWARDVLVRHLVLNINTSLPAAWAGYDYIDDFDTIPKANKVFLKVMGAPVMWLVAKYKTRPALIKSGELKPTDDVREVLHTQVNKFVTEGLPSTNAKAPFHGGARPDLADIDVYGVLQSVRGHAVYDDLLQNTKIAAWVAQMDNATGKTLYVPRARVA
jgi:microsomal prostaglandin-E synthase 2